jgi:predicted amidohydrolase YtcJ
MLLLSLLAAADLIVSNARIWTVNPKQPEAQALAIIGERIVAVGSDKEVAAWRGPKTKVIDARGRRVLPGFNDAHLHFIGAGQQLDQVQLTDARSPRSSPPAFRRRPRSRSRASGSSAATGTSRTGIRRGCRRKS